MLIKKFTFHSSSLKGRSGRESVAAAVSVKAVEAVTEGKT